MAESLRVIRWVVPRLLAMVTVVLAATGALSAAMAAATTPDRAMPDPAMPTSGPASAPSAPGGTPRRPRIGLVLSGGGARGLAHVGVLKVLERERIPIDVIAGTSMGAIIGGLYASGMSADELERELVQVPWRTLFDTRVERDDLPPRRKEEDFEVSPLLELGVRDGELRVPLAAASSRGLESLLRRYTLPARAIDQFDRLPIPFRAVATDMETGAAVVLSSGDLAMALRSSMSVPGVFTPTEIDGRVLGDGGLVDNLPIEVARAMGADVVIAVNIGTPLAGRETLSSVIGLTTQMINILTEQNVQRSLAALGPADVLVAPRLGRLTSADFDHVQDLIALGTGGADEALAKLGALSLDPPTYAAWRGGTRPPAPADATLAFVRYEGSDITNPERFQAQMATQPGQPFDREQAELDARRLAASGDYLRADYRLLRTADGEGLVFDLQDKPWGPDYVRIGLDMSTDFGGDSAFDLKLVHLRRWLTRNGGEWRNLVRLGARTAWASEVYHPLAWSIGLHDDWFVAGYGQVSREQIGLYDPDDAFELGRWRVTTWQWGLDLGRPWQGLGELRLGFGQVRLRSRPLTALGNALSQGTQHVDERGLRARLVIDRLDYAFFPTRGWRLAVEAVRGQRAGGDDPFHRVEGEATAARTWADHTWTLHGEWATTSSRDLDIFGRYALGGFHRLSGYRMEQLRGNTVLHGRLGWHTRLSSLGSFNRGVFVGATAEAGNAWLQRRDVTLGDLRAGMSLFVGTDTGFGPLYLGLTHAPRGDTGLILFIGKP